MVSRAENDRRDGAELCRVDGCSVSKVDELKDNTEDGHALKTMRIMFIRIFLRVSIYLCIRGKVKQKRRDQNGTQQRRNKPVMCNVRTHALEAKSEEIYGGFPSLQQHMSIGL